MHIVSIFRLIWGAEDATSPAQLNDKWKFYVLHAARDSYKSTKFSAIKRDDFALIHRGGRIAPPRASDPDPKGVINTMQSYPDMSSY